MVLGNCIASGHPDFMRASRALHHDGRAIVFEKGTYRMWFGAGVEDNGEEPSPYTFGRIKKFDITVDLRMHNSVLDDVILSLWLLQSSRGRGKKCEIRLQTGCALNVASEPKTLELLGLLRGFEEVVLRVEIDRRVENGHAVSAAGSACHCEKWEREANGVYVKIWGFLEPVLGKAEVVREEGRYCLVYHPGENAKASEG